ncbi:unnamed protein product, partial [Iphiclides podalirius]
MVGPSISFCTLYDATAYQAGTVAKWLSCNGEVWGMGPTVVFASAAALFLFSELRATISTADGTLRPILLENILITPSVLLEITTVGLLGRQSELVPLGPLTRFLCHQQPQIHITVCWFLALCYADYVRKHYCRRFRVPYLEQWQAELQEYAARGMNRTVERMQSFVASVQQRLRSYEPTPPPNIITQT